MTSRVFVFNPFAEGYIARGKAFTPVKHQARLAEDLAKLPQFLCEPEDVVLLGRRPAAGFLATLEQAGFFPPEFIELEEGRIAPTDTLRQRTLGGLRPWAWAPDSVELLEPLFSRVAGQNRTAEQYFNEEIARLYSKAWSADFLKKVLTRSGKEFPKATRALNSLNQPAWRCSPSPPLEERAGERRLSVPERELPSLAGAGRAESWLCSESEVGVAAYTLEDALAAVAAIRARGHQRVVVKEAYGSAGHNALRLWEPELLPAQRHWLAQATSGGGLVVIEPWLERELDFSVHLEKGPRGLGLIGYTGLVNDLKGQFLANWAEPEFSRRLPARTAALFPPQAEESLLRLYRGIFSLLEAELQRVRFTGPLSIDALIYRAAGGEPRLKPVVEINPRYTMGRLTLELMKHACPGTCGLFRLVTRAQARAEGFPDFLSYAAALNGGAPLCLEGAPTPKIRQGALCLNEPDRAQVCLATFAVGPIPALPGVGAGHKTCGN